MFSNASISAFGGRVPGSPALAAKLAIEHGSPSLKPTKSIFAPAVVGKNGRYVRQTGL
jgi:hypothetical protein